MNLVALGLLKFCAALTTGEGVELPLVQQLPAEIIALFGDLAQNLCADAHVCLQRSVSLLHTGVKLSRDGPQLICSSRTIFGAYCIQLCISTNLNTLDEVLHFVTTKIADDVFNLVAALLKRHQRAGVVHGEQRFGCCHDVALCAHWLFSRLAGVRCLRTAFGFSPSCWERVSKHVTGAGVWVNVIQQAAHVSTQFG